MADRLGASYHMTPHREWFDEYEESEGGMYLWEMTRLPRLSVEVMFD